MGNMNYAEITLLVTLLAIYISQDKTVDEIGYLALLFTQIGDTLSTIAFVADSNESDNTVYE